MELTVDDAIVTKRGAAAHSVKSWIFYSFGRAIVFAAAQGIVRSTLLLLEQRRRFEADNAVQSTALDGHRKAGLHP